MHVYFLDSPLSSVCVAARKLVVAAEQSQVRAHLSPETMGTAKARCTQYRNISVGSEAVVGHAFIDAYVARS